MCEEFDLWGGMPVIQLGLCSKGFDRGPCGRLAGAAQCRSPPDDARSDLPIFLKSAPVSSA
jgi:hypothetical protein